MIDFKAELTRLKVEFQTSGDSDEIKLICPFHNDKSPSCHLNVKKQLYNCVSCDSQGNAFRLLAKIEGVSVHIVRDRLTSKYLERDKTKFVEPKVVDQYNTALGNSSLKNELYNRGINDNTIRHFRLGFRENRIIIPVLNWDQRYVNLRSYAPGRSKYKFLNQKDMGVNRLYPLDQLRFDTIIICGGEVKALAAAQRLNEHGIGAIASTGGEASWDYDFNLHFEDKVVYVCFDIDDAGKKGAHKVCSALFGTVEKLFQLQLPLDIEKFPHGDLNDYVMQKDADLLKLLGTATPFGLTVTKRDPLMEPVSLKLSKIIKGDNVDLRIRTKCRVSAVTEGNECHVVPQTLEVLCTKDQAFCQICPIFSSKTNTVKVFEENPLLFSTVQVNDRVKHTTYKDICGIPRACKSCTIKVGKSNVMQAAIVGTDLGIMENEDTAAALTIAYVNNAPNLELNSTYECAGTLTTHPVTGKIRFLASRMEPIEDNLSTFKVENPKELEIFRPKSWSVDGIHERLTGIYKDFENNVTGIFDRKDFHLLCDLTYHSALYAPVESVANRGWVEILVVGDTSQGKTELTARLRNHYGLGESVDCKNATVAGLLGGLEKMGDQFFVSWGLIPTNDRKLVVLEEFKGLKPEVWSALTEMRSSGKAQLPKIERRQTNARTRLIVLSNPQSSVSVSTYAQGILSVRELIKHREDIRRFDACLILREGDANMETREVCKHVYTSELCRKLILWSWTRKLEEIKLEVDVVPYAKKFSKQFTLDIPIVEDMPNKLIRLATALACRTYSAEGDRVLVRKAHVEYIIAMLQRIYTSSAFGYDAFTAASDKSMINMEEVKKVLASLPDPPGSITYLLGQHEVTRDDSLVIAAERIKSEFVWSTLVKNKAVVKSGKSFHKSEDFTKLLKSLGGTEEHGGGTFW